MLINSQKIRYRGLTVGLVLLTAIALSSCGKKAEEPTANNAPNEPTAEVTPSKTATAKDSTKTTSKSSTTGSKTLSAEAQKLGVKPTGTTCPTNAPIKGNINNKTKAKLYHDAKAVNYDKVKPEICFADAATAKKAGFTAPKDVKKP